MYCTVLHCTLASILAAVYYKSRIKWRYFPRNKFNWHGDKVLQSILNVFGIRFTIRAFFSMVWGNKITATFSEFLPQNAPFYSALVI